MRELNMTREQSKIGTIKKMREAISGKEVAEAMLTHFRKFELIALKERVKKNGERSAELKLEEAVAIFREEALVGSRQCLF